MPDVALKSGTHNVKALNDFISTDQIDEHLKMTLQEDLNSMAPGIIIQVQIKRHSVKRGRRPTVRRRSERNGVHPDVLYLARFHLEIYYSCNKSMSSFPPLHSSGFSSTVGFLGGFVRHSHDSSGFPHFFP